MHYYSYNCVLLADKKPPHMTYEEALNRAAAYCSQAERCRPEVTGKLIKWEIESEQQKLILDYLERENFMNEQRYALAFAHDKFRYNKWGKVRIRMELQRKGIPAEVTDVALGSLEHEAYLGKATELAVAKLKSLKYNNTYERDGKLFRFLSGRGFESAVVQKAIQQAIEQVAGD
jgi:regulatory protein